ncbi:MAG: hypothetical protein HPY73_05410 [Methanomassiliicoccales archaeon]|nr:MAG: hypothetical protein HPY73_05410 [Methanomassiliicoccales archaeon]
MGDKLTKFASAMIVWCMVSTSLLGLLLVAAPIVAEGAGVSNADVTIGADNPLVIMGGIYVLGHNLTVGSGGTAYFENCRINVTQNYDPAHPFDPADLMYWIKVQDGGQLILKNVTVTNQLVTQNMPAPGLGIIVRNDGYMLVQNSTLAFPGHFVVDNAHLIMWDSVVKGIDAQTIAEECDLSYFVPDYFDDAPVMLFISSDVQLYNTKLLGTFKNSIWTNTPDLLSFSYPFATDDSSRKTVTYSFERNVLPSVTGTAVGENAVNLTMEDGLFYSVEAGEQLTSQGFDIAGLSFSSADVGFITLNIQYSAPYPFADATPDAFSYTIPFGSPVATGITVTPTWGPDPSDDMEIVKSASLPSMSSQDLANLLISYTNGGSNVVKINRIWVDVGLEYQSYRNITLAGNTNFLAVNSVLDINNYNYTDEYNYTWNKLVIADQATAYLYGVNVTDTKGTPSPDGISPIICDSKNVIILPEEKSILDNTGQSITSLFMNDDNYYSIQNGQTFNINKFTTNGLSGGLLSARLYVRYIANVGYTTSNYLTWGIGESSVKKNAILFSYQTGETQVSYDLFTNGVTTIEDIQSLNISFENVGGETIGIDQLWLEIELDPNVYIYRWANFNVTDEQALPVDGAKISLVDQRGNPLVYISPSGTSSTPPIEVLNYLGRTASDFNITDPFGHASVPVLTEIVNSWSLPRSMDLYGVRSPMRYDATVTYVNATSVLFDESVAVSFEQFPEMSIVGLDLDVKMEGLYVDKPDLLPINPGHSPEPMYKNMTGSTVNVTVWNKGITAAQFITVQVLDIYKAKTIIVANVTVNSLLPGEWAVITVPWVNNTDGLHEIKFIVDPKNTILEEDESNNAISHYVNVLPLLPDLSVSNSDINFSMTPAMTGIPLTITATIYNTYGRADAVNATVSFYLGQPTSGGILIGTDRVTVSAGGQVNATLVWNPSVVGKFTIYVVVSGVLEYSYANNQAYANLAIFVSQSGQLEVNDTVGTMYINEYRNQQQNVIIRENGTLVLNATLFMKQSNANQYWIVVQDNGRLVLNGGGLISSDQALTVYLANNANLTITNANPQSNSKVTIIADDTSSIYIANSGIGYDFIAPSTSQAVFVAYDSLFLRKWTYFGGQAIADLTSVAIPKLDPSENAIINHYRWITVTTYDGSGTVKLSGVYVELKSWNTAIPIYYASGVSDSNAEVKFKAICDVIVAGPSVQDYGNYKINGTYWVDGNRIDSLADQEVSLLYYTEPLSIANSVEKLIIPVLLSDVSIVASDIVVSPTNPVTNTTATLSATIKNLGSQAANGVNITFYLNTTGTRTYLVSRIVTSIPSGQSYTVNVPWMPKKPGNETILVTLDEGQVLNESTRGNNQASINVKVLDIPHIYVSQISFNIGSGTMPISQAIVGQQVKINAKLVNDGESSATDFTVSFWLNQPVTGTLISTVPVSNIAAGSEYTASTFWEATSISGGGAYQNRQIFVTVDKMEYTKVTDVPQSQIIQIIDDRPDLIIEDDVVVTKGATIASGASLGERIKVWFNVTNVGMSTAEDAVILVNMTSGTTNVVLATFVITLDPSETRQYNVSWLVSGIALGTYDLNIWANPNQTFKEASQTNNHYITEFDVVVLEDPVIEIVLQTGGKTTFEPGDKITVSGTIKSKDGIPIVGQPVKVSLRDSKGFQIGTAQTRTTDETGWFITTINVSPDYSGKEAYVTVTINDGVQDVSGSVKINISTEEGLPIPLWLILLIIVVIVLVVAFFSWYLYRYSLGKMVECGECGALIPESSKRCPKCGTVFETGTAKCSECGAWIPANATECPECHAKFLTIAVEPEKGDAYTKAMKEQYDQYVNGYRQQAMAALGSKYSEEKFQEWLKTEPGFLTYDQWVKKTEEDRKSGVFPCPNCGTPNPRGSTICHKCGTVFATVQKEQPPEEKPRTFRKIVKRDKEKKPPEGQ